MNVKQLKDILCEALGTARRVAILGCGSVLLGDDAAGMYIAEKLLNAPHLPNIGENVRVYCGSTAPENFSGEIKRFKPDLLLVIDAADMALKPGEVSLIPLSKITGVSFSTHMLPLRIMLDYIVSETSCSISILGIQSKSLAFSAKMSPAVRASADKLVAVLKDILALKELKAAK